MASKNAKAPKLKAVNFFGKKPSGFSKMVGPKSASTPKIIRKTQHKG